MGWHALYIDITRAEQWRVRRDGVVADIRGGLNLESISASRYLLCARWGRCLDTAWKYIHTMSSRQCLLPYVIVSFIDSERAGCPMLCLPSQRLKCPASDSHPEESSNSPILFQHPKDFPLARHDKRSSTRLLRHHVDIMSTSCCTQSLSCASSASSPTSVDGAVPCHQR